jgi:broad specificity phosphatase PhoE
MVIIWIRHAEKIYGNGKGPIGSKQHDPAIFESEGVKIKNLTSRLIKFFGQPDKIICSPYLRTRQTYNFMKEEFSNMNCLYDENVGEFLGFCNKNRNFAMKPDLEDETKKYIQKSLLLNETLLDLKIRVLNHINEIANQKENIWIITHGIFMSKVYEYLFNKEIRPEPLDYFIFENLSSNNIKNA